MKEITIRLEGATYHFMGEYLRERETKNWHYYRAMLPGGGEQILHIKKDKMICVEEVIK